METNEPVESKKVDIPKVAGTITTSSDLLDAQTLSFLPASFCSRIGSSRSCKALASKHLSDEMLTALEFSELEEEAGLSRSRSSRKSPPEKKPLEKKSISTRFSP